MKKEIIVVEPAVVAGQVNITALARISLKYRDIKGCPSFYVTKQAVFLIVQASGQHKIFRMTGEEVTAEQVKREYAYVTLNQKLRSVLQRRLEQ